MIEYLFMFKKSANYVGFNEIPLDFGDKNLFISRHRPIITSYLTKTVSIFKFNSNSDKKNPKNSSTMEQQQQ